MSMNDVKLLGSLSVHLTTLYHSNWQFLFGNLGHFPLEIVVKFGLKNIYDIWTLFGEFLNMSIFGISRAVQNFGKNGYLHKIKENGALTLGYSDLI